MNPALNHDDIVFRVLLQREDVRPGLTFAVLEQTVPKVIRKALEVDWQGYIRNDGLEYDSAFQKAVRKHLPGLHFPIIAAEFLGKIPFHLALGHFTQPERYKWNPPTVTHDEIFQLADRLEEEYRQRRAEFLRKSSTVSVPPSVEPVPLSVQQKHTGPTRRCHFCRKQIPAAELFQHVDRVHLNPPHLGDGNVTVISPPAKLVPDSITIPARDDVKIREPKKQSLDAHRQFTSVKRPKTEFAQFRRPRCSCGSIAIPGDFYCYHCAPA